MAAEWLDHAALAAPPAAVSFLTTDATRGKGQGLEAREQYFASAFLAYAIAALLEPGKSGVNLLDSVLDLFDLARMRFDLGELARRIEFHPSAEPLRRKPDRSDRPPSGDDLFWIFAGLEPIESASRADHGKRRIDVEARRMQTM